MKKIYLLIAMITFIAINFNFAKTLVNTVKETAVSNCSVVEGENLSKVLAVDFGASDTLTCNGIIQFTDLSGNGAIAWVWHFGDGTGANVQNPVHTYTTAGYYTVTLLTFTSTGNLDSLVKTDYIHVDFLPAPAVSADTTICQYNPVVLTASGSGQIAWFDSLTGGTQLDTGATFASGPLVASTTFYAASQQASPSFFGGPADTTIGTGMYYGVNADRYLRFDCIIPSRLVSVLVFAQGAGSRTVYLQDNNGNQINSATVNIPDGQSRIYLNFDLQPGNGLQLGNTGNSNFFRNDMGATYPYDINGMVSITGNNGFPNGYYFFYDWEISPPPCSSVRIPVAVTVNPGPQASFVYSQNLNTFTCTDLSVGATTWSWDFGDGSGPVTTQNAVHSYTTSGTYVITLTAGNGTCGSSQSVTVNATFAGIDEHYLSQVSLQPNPVKDILTVSLPHNLNNVRLQIINSLGQIVYATSSDEIKNNGVAINFASFAKGFYTLKIESNDEVVLKKIIKD